MIRLSISRQRTQVKVIAVMEPGVNYSAAVIAKRAGLSTQQAAAALYLLNQKCLVATIERKRGATASTLWSLTGEEFEIPGFRKLGEPRSLAELKNVRIGDMSPEEKRIVTQAAVSRLKSEMESPAFQNAVASMFTEGN